MLFVTVGCMCTEVLYTIQSDWTRTVFFHLAIRALKCFDRIGYLGFN